MNRLLTQLTSMSGCLLVSSILACPNPSLALPFDINVLQTTYTTFISSTTEGAGALQTISRSITSSTPHGDSLVREGHTEAAAHADLFELSSHTASAYTPSSDMSGRLATATATTQFSFMPVVDGVAPIELDFKGYYQWYWSDGSVNLFDATLGQNLLQYEWSCCNGTGTIPWEHLSGQALRATAALELPTFLVSTHVYEFSMLVSTSSIPPTEGIITINLSGLRSQANVPEPSTMLLLGSGLVALVAWRWKRGVT